MNRTKKIATIALTGAIAFAPMLALADDSASVSADATVQTGEKHPFLSSIEARISGKHDGKDDASNTASSTDDKNKGDHGQNKIDKGQEKGANAVDARITLLQKLEGRISAMKRLSSDEKTSLSAEVNAQISALADLKAKIGSDTSTSTLIADLKSIRPDYRTYLLVLPRTAIIAASDRVMTIVDQMTIVGTKLETRITAAKAAGADVSAAESAYTDYQAKVADAKVQAQAANDLVLNLKVDSGDATVQAANTAAIKSARTKLQAAQADLVAARKDMTTIISAVKGKGTVTASTTVSTH